MDPILAELERVAGSCDWGRPRIPLVSNLTGAPVEAFDGAYWREHAREPVRFADGVERPAGVGCNVFLETGPQPVASGLGSRVGPDRGGGRKRCRGAEARRTAEGGGGKSG